jgi:hypothetical protein
VVGRGEMRRCRALYASAEVEEAVDSNLCCWTCRARKAGLPDFARRGRERIAFREAMMTRRRRKEGKNWQLQVNPVELTFLSLVLLRQLKVGQLRLHQNCESPPIPPAKMLMLILTPEAISDK